MTREPPVATEQLTASQYRQLRAMLDVAYDGDFSDADWEHTIGGRHFIVFGDDTILSHVSVVQRTLVVGGRALRTGFVEAVATVERHRRRGYGTTVMRAAGEFIRERYELGSLCTGEHVFYERLGWERWQGPTFVRNEGRWTRTPDEDDAVMVLRTTVSSQLDLTDRISCEWRVGDVW